MIKIVTERDLMKEGKKDLLKGCERKMETAARLDPQALGEMSANYIAKMAIDSIYPNEVYNIDVWTKKRNEMEKILGPYTGRECNIDKPKECIETLTFKAMDLIENFFPQVLKDKREEIARNGLCYGAIELLLNYD